MSEEVTPTEPTVEQPTVPTVTMQDLAMAVRVIDLAVERGAYKGNEASTVGLVRDRISRFVEASQPKAPVDAPAETPAA